MNDLDLTYLKSVTDGDQDLMKELVEIFQSQVPEYIEEFDAAFQQKDVEALMQLAHKSKSSVAIMCLNSLAENLAKFEEEARKGEFKETFKDYIEDFKTQSQSAMQQLKKLI